MDQRDGPEELERKIELASRISASINDQTTIERLRKWVDDLRLRLRERLAARRTKQEIEARARELWEQNGCPAGRDLEFWLQAEAEIAGAILRRHLAETAGWRASKVGSPDGRRTDSARRPLTGLDDRPALVILRPLRSSKKDGLSGTGSSAWGLIGVQ